MEWSDGEKTKNYELGEKNEKGERKKEENYIKKGEKGFKNASFWDINSKKIESQKRGGGGNDQNAQYISLDSCFVH